MQGRGLKPALIRGHFASISVAPYAGAWIETWFKEKGYEVVEGRPLCRGVD